MSVKKKETVLMVHNYYQIPGGEDTVVANEKKMLEDHGHKVVLYTRHNNEIKNLSFFGKFLLIFRTIFNWRTYMDIRCIIREENIDIVHVHNTLPLISPAVYYAAISMKKPVIQTVHNFRLLCPAATFYRDGRICEDCLHIGLLQAMRYGCYRHSKIQTAICVLNLKIHSFLGIYKKIKYIALTEFNKNKICKGLGLSPYTVYVKPNFVNNVSAFHEKEKDIQYIFIGRLEEIKGIDFLLAAWRMLGKNAPKLLICGMGPLEEWCRQYISDYAMHTVKIMGQVSHDQVMVYMRESICLVFPTCVYEGFPVTIVEAFANGLPVICPDIGNAGNLITNGENGYKFISGDVDSLLECISHMKKDYMELGINAHKTYESKYTEIINYQILMDIYKTAYTC